MSYAFAEAAKALNISHYKLRKLLKSGAIPFSQTHKGSTIMINLVDMNTYTTRQYFKSIKAVDQSSTDPASSTSSSSQHDL